MRSKRAFYNIISNAVLQIVVIIFGFIMPRVIIGKYGSDVNGLVSSITNFLSYISLVEAGFGGVVQYLLYKPISKKDKKGINDILAASQKFFGMVTLVFIIYIIILCFLYPLMISDAFNGWFTTSLIIIISISMFAEYYFGLVYKVFLFADQKKYIVSLFSILAYGLNIATVLFLSNFNVSIQILELASALLFVVRPLLQNIYVRKKYKIDLKKGNKQFKIEQKWDALAQHIAAVIHNNTDAAILTLFRSLDEVSVYAIYALVSNGIKKVVSMFYDSISPGFGDMIAKKENKKLNEVFNAAETFFFTFVAIIFACAFVLITPFVEIYTKGITDTNYIQPVFGYLIVFAALLSAVRHPYSSVTLAAGHYKQTRNGAILECTINVLVSIMLVIRFGLIGVAIGTAVAMFIRTCEFIYHSSKYILKRKVIVPIRKIILMAVELLVITGLSNFLPLLQNGNYFNWAINAMMMIVLSCAICLPINIFLLKEDFKKIIVIFHKALKRVKR